MHTCIGLFGTIWRLSYRSCENGGLLQDQPYGEVWVSASRPRCTGVTERRQRWTPACLCKCCAAVYGVRMWFLLMHSRSAVIWYTLYAQCCLNLLGVCCMYSVASPGVHCRYSVSLLGVHYKYNVASLGVHCMHNVGSQGVHCMHSVAWLCLVYAVCTMLPHCRYSVSLLVLTHLVYTMCTILHCFCVRYMYNVSSLLFHYFMCTVYTHSVYAVYNEPLFDLVYNICTMNPYLTWCTLCVQRTLTWLGAHSMYNEPLLDLVYTVCTKNPYLTWCTLYVQRTLTFSAFFHTVTLHHLFTLRYCIVMWHCMTPSQYITVSLHHVTCYVRTQRWSRRRPRSLGRRGLNLGAGRMFSPPWVKTAEICSSLTNWRSVFFFSYCFLDVYF